VDRESKRIKTFRQRAVVSELANQNDMAVRKLPLLVMIAAREKTKFSTFCRKGLRSRAIPASHRMPKIKRS